MKVDVVMPKMGESVNEGTIIKWHKKEGDKVKKDEIIFEISTDKVDTEIPSPADGVLTEIKAQEQETVDAESVVAIIDSDGESEDASSAPDDDKSEESKSSKKEESEESSSSEKEEKEEETGSSEKEESEDEESDEEEEEETPSTTQVGGELVDIPMPKMGESVMEGTIIKWHKKEGDKVKKDEIIFEISTDKVDTEIPSPEDGTLAEILVGENETVEVGEVVARVSKSGGLVEPKKKVRKEEKSTTEKDEEKIEREDSRQIEEKDEEVEENKTPDRENRKPSAGGNRFYSPLVMKIAEKENVSYDELEDIEGSGNEGRVTKKDILSYLEDRKSGKKAPLKKEKQQEVEVSKVPTGKTESRTEGKVEVIPMDNIRQRIMYHMENSRDTSVHVTAILEVDMTKIHNFLEKNKEKIQKEDGVKLTYMAFISYAAIKALKEFPFVNATIEDKNILLKKFINLGIAVSVEPNGLIVPNIKNADDKNIRGLAKAISELSYKSRNKKLTPDDIMNGTFTITNYGVFGSLFGTPIINQPELGILGVGAVTKKPVVVEVEGTDVIAIKPMMYLSLSHDHRSD